MTNEMYNMLHRILSDRVIESYSTDRSAWIAYESALTMLEYAQKGDYVCLAQYAKSDN